MESDADAVSYFGRLRTFRLFLVLVLVLVKELLMIELVGIELPAAFVIRVQDYTDAGLVVAGIAAFSLGFSFCLAHIMVAGIYVQIPMVYNKSSFREREQIFCSSCNFAHDAALQIRAYNISLHKFCQVKILYF